MDSRRFSQNSTQLPPPTREQISALAHELWRERGCPEGSDVDIWLEAERQLNGGSVAKQQRDPIPADPDRLDPDDDPALNPNIDRQLRGMGGGDRSPTSFGLR
jgi:hypothetical protein